MKLEKQFEIAVSGRRLDHFHTSQIDFVAKTVARLLAGEDVDLECLKPYGLRITRLVAPSFSGKTVEVDAPKGDIG